MSKKIAPKKNQTGKIVAGAIGIAAISAVAYLLMGPNGKKNRKDLKAWMLKMKAEVAEKIEGLKDITKEKYDNIVDEVSKKYSKIKNIDQSDLNNEINHLKKEWSKITNAGKKTVVKKLTKKTK